MTKESLKSEINLVNLTYQVGSSPLFSNLSIRFDGNLVGITGENGCGKSTLLSMLSGCCQPHAGEIQMKGRSLYRHLELKNQIGYVSAFPFLYPHLTLIENLKLIAIMRKVSKKTLMHSIHTVLYQCDLFDYQKVLFGKLSDGIKKRAMLAQALIHQPRILILDEPCTGLCPKQRQFLWRLLQHLAEQDKFILFSTHHPQEVSEICDAMYEIHSGKLHLLSNRDLAQTMLQSKALNEPNNVSENRA